MCGGHDTCSTGVEVRNVNETKIGKKVKKLMLPQDLVT